METTNNFKPILFSTEMVQSILENRKKQTRRIVNPQPNYLAYTDSTEGHEITLKNYINEGLSNGKITAKYQIGDILWVRETWQTSYNENSKKWDPIYKADGKFWMDDDGPMKWKPSLFMVKKHCRIFLKVTNVRCERLNDITEDDAIAEGIDRFENSLFNETRYRDYTDGKRRDKDFNRYPEMAKQVGYSHYGGNPWPDWRDPINSFQSLWDSINAKKHPWESNPWVWVYEFERIEKPENFNNKNL